MTTKQTIDGVPGLRELLERVATEANHMLGFTYAANYDEWRAAVDELRALLDAPAVESELARMTRRCQNAELALKVQTENYEALKAAQPKGEPVALAVWYGSMPESNGKSNWTAILYRKGSEGSLLGALSDGITIDRSEYPERVRYEADRVRYLIGELKKEPWILDYDSDKHSGYVYAEQPAPVAVVMPERLREIHEFLLGSESLDGYAFGSLHPSGRKYWWRNELRACLNTARPAHANPPPGTEPSGTHRDNDGLDEWRKA